jgi:hypothetical protein
VVRGVRRVLRGCIWRAVCRCCGQRTRCSPRCWTRNQQLARNLAFSTIDGREKVVQAFARHVDAFRWNWTPQLVDEWFGDL